MRKGSKTRRTPIQAPERSFRLTVCLIDAQGRRWNRIVWERSPILADTRLFLEAVFWIASTGAPWRDSPAYSGNWNTVFKRFRHWVKADVFKRIFDAASDDPGMEYAMIDATNTSDPAGAVCPASRSRLRLDFVRERVARLSLSSRSWRGAACLPFFGERRGPRESALF
ncbi:MAG: transposase [Rhodomicrobium sp.]